MRRVTVPRPVTGRDRSRTATALLGLLLSAVGGLLGVLGSAAPAAAHAALTDSTPAKGAVVDHAPGKVTLGFSEGIAMSEGSLRVLDPHGRRADHGGVRETAETQRTVALKSGLRNGTYTVAWRGISADSHPVSGAFTFSVGAPSKTHAHVPQQNGQSGDGGLVGLLYGAGRYAAYAGFMLLTGGAVFLLGCWRRGAGERPMQRLVVAGWTILTSATLLMLLLRNSYTKSGQLAEVFDLGGLTAAVGTKPGAALLCRLLLLGAGALFLSVLFGPYARTGGADHAGSQGAEAAGIQEAPAADDPGTPVGGTPGCEPEVPPERSGLRRWLCLGGSVLAAGLAATWSLAEHASTGIQTALAMPVDLLHLLAVGCWLGGLTALLTALYRCAHVPRAAVARFSRLAFGSVLVLVGTGLYQSWRQVGSWSALTDTSYGQLLLVKVALVAVLLTVAWFSRRWTARLAAAPRQGQRTGNDQATAVREGLPAGEPAGEHATDEPAFTGGSSNTPETGAGTPNSAGPDSGEAGEPVAVPAGPVEQHTRVAEPAQDGDSGNSGPGRERSAQLARQRAAVAAARRKRDREADPQRTGLRRSVLAETAVAVVLLAVTTALTNTEPARTETATHAGGGGSAQQGPVRLSIPFDTGGGGGKGTAKLRLSPGRSGDNTLRVTATDPAGKPVDAPEVKVAFTLPSRGLGPLNVTPHPAGGGKSGSGSDSAGSGSGSGRWEAKGVQLPMPGTWHVAFTIRTSDIDQITEYKKVRLR